MAGGNSAGQTQFRKAMRRDRIAAVAIRFGGAAVVFAVAAMLFLIVSVSAPLFYKPKLRPVTTFTAALEGTAIASGVTNDGTLAYTIDGVGGVSVLDVATGAIVNTVRIREDVSADSMIVTSDSWGGDYHAFLWNDGSLSALRLRLLPRYESGVRELRLDIEAYPVEESFDAVDVSDFLVRRDEASGSMTIAVLKNSGALDLVQIRETRNFLDEVTRDISRTAIETAREIELVTIAVDSKGENLYGGSSDGRLLRWRLPEDGAPTLEEDIRAFDDNRAITALGLVFGDISLAVANSAGGVSTWSPVRPEPESAKELRLIHALPSSAAPVREIRPTLRNKGFFTHDDAGAIRYYHMTTERMLVEIVPDAPVATFAQSENAAEFFAVLEGNRMAAWNIVAPHPEASVHTLFEKVWYENYDQPEYVWQSSASSDDYEPKLSLVPLIFGSFKGTVYAMIFAIPMALFGAAYTSQFVRPGARSYIKSTVEIMASVPSVIIGFVIALWLAPIIDEYLVSFFSFLLVLPAVFVVFMILYRFMDNTPLSRRIERGYEFVVIVPVILIALGCAALVAGPAERFFFDDNFKQWLFEQYGERYDQRNAIIIAVGLGFAAIPIIFTIAEDALSNLPQHLRAGSLALGASRWQTVWRVVMPSASPGIFAAVIIGFGRVIGETMIVLMATGNTPIMDWSPFNGMRTLSANIAVEIPEAPVDGTLYRVLFLSAVILFLMTFALNTAAEIIRQRLRKKYGRFQ